MQKGKQRTKRDHSLDPKGRPKLGKEIKATVLGISEGFNDRTGRKPDGGGGRFCPQALGNLGPNIYILEI